MYQILSVTHIYLYRYLNIHDINMVNLYILRYICTCTFTYTPYTHGSYGSWFPNGNPLHLPAGHEDEDDYFSISQVRYYTLED